MTKSPSSKMQIAEKIEIKLASQNKMVNSIGTNIVTNEFNREDYLISKNKTNARMDNIENEIPTVNNGTLTIKQNGSTLGTFTANQSTNTEVNITGGGLISSIDTGNIGCVIGDNSYTYTLPAGRTLLGANLIKVTSSGGSGDTQISNFGWSIVNLDTSSLSTPMSQKITFTWNYAYYGGNHTVKIRIYFI